MASYFVKRTSKHNAAGLSYVGPLPLARAEREAAAWQDAGETAELLETTPTVRAEVRRWERVTRAADAHEVVTFEGRKMTRASYLLREAD